ncbi:carboxypeptidase-like regulatory domain-containing protein [Porifericola rhodea]|uniref:carboxypeptidase-like regulatory domain-containing protein n=1 Tax=Porifericola rhodea TaxID=930972 RepID=UPI0026662DE8|nr:carboxypeptidase-like regulatory domain-containing protein [Porifericola rhodea]WKN29664.1 carboxypeptidase-like regulatory domain-containing protein [Porifericola rhodea]
MKKISLIILAVLVIGAVFAFIQAPEATISGKVSSGGEPLPGVDVSVSGTNQGTVTNLEGKYSLEVGSNADTLIFSSLGYQTKKVAINGKNTINVQLSEE